MNVGQTLCERYLLVAVLGVGGAGRVWKARDILTQRDVAIKELLTHEGFDKARRAELYSRCFREVKNAARLDHTDVVTIYDVLTTEDGRPWIVMQYLDLPTLNAYVGESGPIRSSTLSLPALRLLEAVAYVHDKGVLHRDLKPENLMRRDDGSMVVLDFGIARSAEDTATVDGFHCTAAYAAPEVLEGKESTEKSDAWSLGLVLHYALTGSVFYRRDTFAATMIAVVNETPPLLVGNSPLELVIKGLLVKDPRKRLSVKAAAVKLREAVAVAAAQTKTATGAVKPVLLTSARQMSDARGLSRRRILATLVGVGVLMAATFAVVESTDDTPRDVSSSSTGMSTASPNPSPSSSTSTAPESPSPSPSTSVLQTGGTFTNGKLSIRLGDSWSVTSVDADNVIYISAPTGNIQVKLQGLGSVEDIAEALSKAEGRKLDPTLHYPVTDVAEWGYHYTMYCPALQKGMSTGQGSVSQAGLVSRVDYLKGFLCAGASYSRVWRPDWRAVSARVGGLLMDSDSAKRTLDDLAGRISLTT